MVQHRIKPCPNSKFYIHTAVVGRNNYVYSIDSLWQLEYYKNFPSERKDANGPQLLRSGPGEISEFLVLFTFLGRVDTENIKMGKYGEGCR